jgi:hypothetical protein
MKKTVFFLLMIGAGLASADIIASWEISGVDVDTGTGIDEAVSPYAFTSTSIVTGIEVAKLQLSSAVNPSTTASQYGCKVSTTETSLANAITAGHYIEISISVTNGYKLNLSSIEMNGQASSTGWSDAAFMSAIAGYTAGNELDSVTGIAGITGGLDTDSSGWGSPIDLSGAAYQGLTGTTTFRIYGWGASSGSGVSYIRSLSGDDLVINGAVSVVPEPAALSMIGFGGLLMLFVRRFYGK